MVYKWITDNKVLREKNVHIWDGNSSQWLYGVPWFGLCSQCDLGPIYGFQWRNFGGGYNISGKMLVKVLIN